MNWNLSVLSCVSHLFCCWAFLIPPQLFIPFACDSPQLVFALVVKIMRFRVQMNLLVPSETCHHCLFWFLLYSLRCSWQNLFLVWCLWIILFLYFNEKGHRLSLSLYSCCFCPVAGKRGKDADTHSYFTSEALFLVSYLIMIVGKEGS